ncbi:hypothetical protein [Nodularia sp. UHCC 0506]|uniref:hypothetical protein n=1 Tax=Nodularia sp. UHCC 0506 TaxID=3110243 RepID=UPI002B1F0A81|nr:hypothetical protein [Nodularia sp. UHCC 0506]MEA5514351.1 hypothetical protein [Nodularia sp. UHCC 0506]
MNFPNQLQQKIEEWASIQGVSTEEFVLEAIAEKINALSQQTIAQNSEATNQARIYRKNGILVIDVELPESFNFNNFTDELREESIRHENNFTHLGNALSNFIYLP